MITRFGEITKDGLIAYRNLKIYTKEEVEEGRKEGLIYMTYEKNQDLNIALKVKNTYLSGIVWENDGEEHILQNDNYRIEGYPSIDRQYVIAFFYKGCETFPPPHNAVIYKANGELHKVLDMPKLESEIMLAEIIGYSRASNPPVEYAGFGLGNLCFASSIKYFCLVESEDLKDIISISFGINWLEDRVLYPSIGEVGELVEARRR